MLKKEERKIALRNIEVLIRTGIVRDDREMILNAHDAVLNMLAHDGILILSQKPQYPDQEATHE